MLERAETDMRLRIAKIRGECVSAFASLVERLGDVRAGLDGVGAQVSGLAEMLVALGDGPEPRGTIVSACENLASALERAQNALARDAVLEAIFAAIEALDAIARQAKQLNAISSITCVTAGSTGAEALGDYVVSLRHMTEDLAGAAQVLGEGLGMIRSAHVRVLGDIVSAEQCVQRAVTRIGAPQAQNGALADDREGLETRLAEGARTLAQAAARETGALIVAMQFSDSLAQRLEHVEAILAGSGGRDNASRGLAAAQLSALADDAAQTLETIADVLARLGDTGSNAAAALKTRDGSQVADMLAARRADLSEGTALQALVVPALAEAQEGAERIWQQIDLAREGYSRLTDTATGVNLSAINATLLTARGGAARAAMAVLSEAVRGSARDCSDQSSRCRAAMAVLETAVHDAGFDALATSSQTLRETISRCAGALASAERDLSRLSELQDRAAELARALVEVIGIGETSLARVLPAIDGLRSAAKALGQGVVSDHGGAAQLDRFMTLYTMPREREVHARFCGQPTAEAVTAGQDLADILF